MSIYKYEYFMVYYISYLMSMKIRTFVSLVFLSLELFTPTGPSCVAQDYGFEMRCDQLAALSVSFSSYM